MKSFERANTTDYGLAAAIWSRDIKKAHTIAEQLRGHGLDQLLRRLRRGRPVWRLQGQRHRPRAGRKALDNYTEHKTVTVAPRLIARPSLQDGSCTVPANPLATIVARGPSRGTCAGASRQSHPDGTSIRWLAVIERSFSGTAPLGDCPYSRLGLGRRRS